MAEQSSLFDEKNTDGKKKTPSAQINKSGGELLAARMRPHTVGEIVGQEQILGRGRLLHRAIESDRIMSMILWEPPGSGKTTRSPK